jgi:hypothetical protein
VLDKASVGRKMRWSGATTAGSEVRVAAEFDGIEHLFIGLFGWRSRGQVEFYLQADLDPIRFQFGEGFVGSTESPLRFGSSRVGTEGDDGRGRLGRWLGRGFLLGQADFGWAALEWGKGSGCWAGLGF